MGVRPAGRHGEVSWVGRLLPTGFEITLFSHPERERAASWLALWEGRYGPKHWLVAPSLSWSANSCDAIESGTWVRPEQPQLTSLGASAELTITPFSRSGPFGAPGYEGRTDDRLEFWPSSTLDAPWLPEPMAHGTEQVACPAWKRPHAVTIARYNGEYERIRLLECDGSVSSDTIDRLSVLARPALRERPSLPLPLEPEPDNIEHEWLPQLKLVHPRLAWVLQRISSAYPGRVIYLMSGYRPEAGPESLHRQGRALDLFVRGVPNEALFQFCRSLPQVGCGYYPNNRFVHVDVRPPTTAKAFWVDVSGPGESSRYVDSWPGVVAGGALDWAGVD